MKKHELALLDKAIQKTHVWFKDLMQRLDCDELYALPKEIRSIWPNGISLGIPLA